MLHINKQNDKNTKYMTQMRTNLIWIYINKCEPFDKEAS